MRRTLSAAALATIALAARVVTHYAGYYGYDFMGRRVWRTVLGTTNVQSHYVFDPDGHLIAGAIRMAKDLGPGHTIVTVLCDYGNRYQSKLFNPEFLRSKNLPVPHWLEARPGTDWRSVVEPESAA